MSTARGPGRWARGWLAVAFGLLAVLGGVSGKAAAGAGRGPKEAVGKWGAGGGSQARGFWTAPWDGPLAARIYRRPGLRLSALWIPPRLVVDYLPAQLPPPIVTQDVIDYLRAAQNADGSFNGWPYWIVSALQILGASPSDPQAAVGHFLSLENADGSFSGAEGAAGDLWPTREAVLSLLMLNSGPTSANATVSYIARRQGDDGNFHDNNDWGDEWGLGSMLSVLLSLTGANSWAGVDEAAAIEYLDERQQANGSWFNEVFHTYWALLAYHILGQVPPGLDAALAYIYDSQQPAGYLGRGGVVVRSSQTLDPADYTWQLAALAALYMYQSAPRDEQALRNYIIANYGGDGSWHSDPTQTAGAAMTLALLDGHPDAVQRWVNGMFGLPADRVVITTGVDGAPNPVASGGQVQCSVTASDPLGHNLSYQWTATDAGGDPVGGFDDPTSPSPIWTAPVNRTDQVVSYTISVTVTCAEGQQATGSYQQQVNPVPDEVRIAAGPSGQPNPVGSGGQVQCSVTAEDSRRHALTYQWTATDADGNPAGSFENADSAKATWTAPANYTDAPIKYTISVTVTCERGQQATASYEQVVNPVPDEVRITDGPKGEPNPVESEGQVQCSVTAEDSRGHPVSYRWQARGPDGKAAGSFDDPTKANPVWTAPLNAGEQPVQYTISVTVTCEKGAKAEASFVQEVLGGHKVRIVDVTFQWPRPPDENVRSGETLPCAVEAEDTLGHELSYLWQASFQAGQSAGSFDDPTSATPTWTPPEVAEETEVNFTVTVICSEGLRAVENYRVTVVPRLTGDVDGDGQLTARDIALFFVNFRAVLYGKKKWDPGADVDHDGDVDANDAAALLEAFLRAGAGAAAAAAASRKQ